MPRTGIAGRKHTRFTSESIHHQARIVGKTVESITVANPASLYQGISLESVGSLRYIVMTSYVGERKDFHIIACDSANFLKFMGIICGKYDSLHKQKT